MAGCADQTSVSEASSTNAWHQDILVPGSSLHTVNGLALDPAGNLLIASLASDSIFKFDPQSKEVSTEIPAQLGRSDDIALSESGQMYWTDPIAGVVRTRHDDGTVSVVADNLPGANSIAFSPDRGRLFVGQTFFADSFWEIDAEGKRPHRLVAENTGGVNAFAFGTDGMIYGPVAHDGTVVRMDPDSGRTEVVASGLKTPVSVRWGPGNHLYALAGATGEIIEIDPQTGSTKPVAQVAAPVDNMVITQSGTIYVTNMADNAVIAVDAATGSATSLIEGELAFPKDIALASEEGQDVLYVADSTALRRVDTVTGEVTDLARRMTSALQFPSGIDVSPEHIYLANELTGSVQVVDRPTGEFVGTMSELDHPTDVVGLDDGTVLVAEGESGRIVRVDGARRTVVVEGLAAPTSLVSARNGSVYFAESAAGRILKLNVDTSSAVEVATDFGAIRSVDVLPDGRLAVLEASSGDVQVVDPSTGLKKTIAENLPVGYLQDPYPRSGGMAVGSDGAIYVAADKDNAILKLTENQSA
ncbi:hypothetical protein GS500_14810 [Rhodococcus hoagii]|nr:hypothetical protein [Prescottella equi]